MVCIMAWCFTKHSVCLPFRRAAHLPRAEPFWLPQMAAFGHAGTMPEVDEVWSALDLMGTLD